jgi:tRNA pseudouridine32 synthase/23S rRNA pseudouridine746 synthase
LHIVSHITVEKSDTTTLSLLSDNTVLSQSQIKQALASGCVWLESAHGIKRTRRAKKILTAGNQVHLYYDDAILSTTCKPARLVADEQAYSVWYKPPGMFSQGSKWGDHCTLYRYAELHLKPQRPAFIVHRLDRATSGLMLIAHSKKAATMLTQLFESRNITKRYYAIVEGNVHDMDTPYIIESTIEGKIARSEILDYQACGDHSVMNMELHTGRKHQLRRQLAELGHPVIGDRLYGSSHIREDLQLQCYYLAFKCPVTHEQREYILDQALLINHLSHGDPSA